MSPPTRPTSSVRAHERAGQLPGAVGGIGAQGPGRGRAHHHHGHPPAALLHLPGVRGYGVAVSPAIDRLGRPTNQLQHNTSQLFDRLHLLSDGKTIFFGPTHEAVGYFEQAGFRCPPLWNAADFLLDLIATDYRSPEAEKETKARVAGLYLRNVTREGKCTCSNDDYAALAAQAEAAAGQGGRWTLVRFCVAFRFVAALGV